MAGRTYRNVLTQLHIPTHHPWQTFINVVACPEGLEALFQAFPNVKVFTGAVDASLNADRYIVPGLGDFGDRFYGTSLSHA